MNAVLNIPAWITDNHAMQTEISVPAWFSTLRENQWQTFLEKGLPTRRDERWKYANLLPYLNKNFVAATTNYPEHLTDVVRQHRLQRGDSVMLVCVNGYFVPELSDLAVLPTGVIACRLSEALCKYEQLVQPYLAANIDAVIYPFASLNTAMCSDGLFLYVPKQHVLSTPIHLLSITTQEQPFIAHPRRIIVLEEQSQCVLVEEHFSQMNNAYLMNIVTSIAVKKAARLDYCKLQAESKEAIHLAHTFIDQHQDSIVEHTTFSIGSLFARDEFAVLLKGSGANCRTSGFYHLTRDKQYIDHHLDIQHHAPHSQSEMLYKGILQQQSCAVFNGRLVVAKDAQKILAYQANHNLLITKGAEVYSKPELEIYADDVKCKHGATTGQIDQDALFYLQSRGLDKTQAIEMLLQGFSEEIMQRISHLGIKMRAGEIMTC